MFVYAGEGEAYSNDLFPGVIHDKIQKEIKSEQTVQKLHAVGQSCSRLTAGQRFRGIFLQRFHKFGKRIAERYENKIAARECFDESRKVGYASVYKYDGG